VPEFIIANRKVGESELPLGAEELDVSLIIYE